MFDRQFHAETGFRMDAILASLGEPDCTYLATVLDQPGGPELFRRAVQTRLAAWDQRRAGMFNRLSTEKRFQRERLFMLLHDYRVAPSIADLIAIINECLGLDVGLDPWRHHGRRTLARHVWGLIRNLPDDQRTTGLDRLTDRLRILVEHAQNHEDWQARMGPSIRREIY